ncbi:hypothetical protein ALC57_07043, partial [Trachymyrmex cornetzi]
LHIMRSCSPGIWPALVRANKYPKARNREAWRDTNPVGTVVLNHLRRIFVPIGSGTFHLSGKNPLSTLRRATRHLDFVCQDEFCQRCTTSNSGMHPRPRFSRYQTLAGKERERIHRITNELRDSIKYLLDALLRGGRAKQGDGEK